jgi:DNA-binding transcriptional LysR family regulator
MVDLDLRRLRLLRELQERGTLAAVADALGYTPSAVSQQLAVLEREAGVRLLEKAGRGVRLTDAGLVLAEHAVVLLAAAAAAQADLAALGGQVRGTVRAGGLQSATRALLVPALVRSGGDHPDVRIELTELELEQALPELRLGGLDLVVSDEYDGHPRPRPAGVRFEPLHAEPLRLVLPAAHRLAAASGPVPIAALRDDVWVASAAGTGHHALVVGTCRTFGGYEPDLRHRSSDADVQLALVRTAGAVALLPPLTLPEQDATIAVREVAEGAVGRCLVMITREGPTTPALAAFVAAVRDVAGGLGGTTRAARRGGRRAG